MASDPSPAAERSTLPGEAGSLWLETSATTDYTPLRGGLAVDTVVVGGGIVGVTTAMQLVEAGQDVALLEADRILNGVTGHTTAKLTSLHGLVYEHVRSTFGEREARLYAEANEAAIDHVEAEVNERDIDCAFERTPAYTYVADEGSRRKIEKEVATASHLGLPASFTESVPIVEDATAAVRFDEQAHFHPRKYLLAQAERFADAGGHLFERTRATEIHPGSPVEVRTDRGTVAADDAVVATHFPLHDHGLYFARMTPKRGYVLSVVLEEPAAEGMLYRSSDPYFSVHPRAGADPRRVLVGGQNHRTGHSGNAFERYRKLERAARERLDVERVEYRWSTQDFSTVDSVPFVGKLAPQTQGVYVATGFGGWGMTGGVAAGLLLSDQILGEPNDWADVFDPGRFNPGTAAKELVEHNVHSAERFVTDRLKFSLETAAPELEAGEGTVVQERSSPVGLFRHESGHVHSVSAVCPHMGCVLEWNGADRSWDCPCHGSRFEYDGSVIDGPAMKDLETVDYPR